MKISVIIPFYNEENDLKECLTSLKRQSYSNFEVILVNDGGKKIINLKKEFMDFKFLNQKHQGPGPARNKGAREAEGEILVFVDSDMVFHKDFLKNLIKPIARGETKGTFSKEEYVANWENIWARCWSFNKNLGKRLIPDNYPDEAPVFRAILKKEFKTVGGFSSIGYTDDWTLSKKLGFKAKVAPHAIYYHYNPASLKEVFLQARWIGKRKRRFGIFGIILNLLRRSLPLSLFFALFLSLKYKEPKFFVFRIVYDFAEFIGSSLALTGGSKAK